MATLTVVWDIYGKRIGEEGQSPFDLIKYIGLVPSSIPLSDLSG